MTRKETLYLELLKKQNELSTLKGEPVSVELTDDYISSWTFTRNANQYKIEELKKKIENTESYIRSYQEKKKVEKFFATPAGIRLKANNTRLIDELVEKRKQLHLRGIENITEIIKTVCGERWGVTQFNCGYIGSMTIGVLDPNDNGKTVFGKYFNIRFEAKDINGDEVQNFEMSYGSCGSFDPLADDDDVEFIIGMGKFMTNAHVINKLKMYCLELCHEAEELSHEIDKLRHELEHPEIK